LFRVTRRLHKTDESLALTHRTRVKKKVLVNNYWTSGDKRSEREGKRQYVLSTKRRWIPNQWSCSVPTIICLCMYVCMYVYIYIYVATYACIYVCTSTNIYIFIYLFIYTCFFLHLPTYLSIIYLSVSLSTCMSVYLSVYPSVYPSIHPSSIYLSVYISIHLSIYLSRMRIDENFANKIHHIIYLLFIHF